MSQDVIQAPELAPGCFGSALAFSKTDMVCNACPFAGRCEPAHEKSKALLKARFGIGFRKSRTAPAQPKVETTEVEFTEEPRVNALLRWIEAMNVGVHDKLREGINPFGDKTRFLSIICHLLINRPKVTKPAMLTALMAVMKLDESTARADVDVAIKVLLHLGAITESQGIYALRRS